MLIKNDYKSISYVNFSAPRVSLYDVRIKFYKVTRYLIGTV